MAFREFQIPASITPAVTPPLRIEITSLMLLDVPHFSSLPTGIPHIAEIVNDACAALRIAFDDDSGAARAGCRWRNYTFGEMNNLHRFAPLDSEF